MRLIVRPMRAALFLAAAFCIANLQSAAQVQSSSSHPAVPEAPASELPRHSGAIVALPCEVKTPAAKESAPTSATPSSEPGSAASAAAPVPNTSLQAAATLPPCPPTPTTDWFARFIDGPQTRHMTPMEKAWLAMRDVADPFNGFTILASSAITIGSDSHTPYGPGMAGFGRYVGVSYTQDMTGEFLGTFLIPSIARQDPHYHRWPRATFKRRLAHAAYQVLWTQGDNGHEMLNYANLVGFAAEDEIANLYVPGRATRLSASAERYGSAFASAPINNYITEFLPDIARHIHTRVVTIQRIINQVAKTGGPQ
jgi:hypothetical protein